MSIILTDYSLIQVIDDNTNTCIYRAYQESTQTSVIIKTLKTEYPTIEQITRLRYEYQILQSLRISGVIQPLALESTQNKIALILEDFLGETLHNFISTNKLELTQILQIAIQLASTLAQLHQNNIIHKDIQPHNILIDPNTNQIKIINFSIASRLHSENQTINNINLLEGSLAYLSPEQTGRMNRLIDYRTDFYSLGVTLYQMLVGKLPFVASDPLEIIHSHIAKTPIAPQELNPQIPVAVSNIVLKLLAKTAEDRYQNALGLKADLESCLYQLQTTGKITDLVIGKLDLNSQLLIPQKLYGREQEVAQLMGIFERVSSGSTELTLVSGYSGIGKSSLVNEFSKSIIRQGGYFIGGKFDQYKRHIPYAAFIQAFQEVIRQILTESAEKITSWKMKILSAVGVYGQVIIEVIPDVEKIIGTQPEIPSLGINEAQNRFNRLFQQFIHVFAQAEHPLVIFLDDLQWADVASLKLIQLLISDIESKYLLLMGAYREHEVTPSHPLILTLAAIQKNGVNINKIVLQPLNISHVQQLVSDTLSIFSEDSQELADLVFHKTQGNPFFVTQLLKSLHQENFLSFNFDQACWQWHIETIKDIDITDNVVELMVNQIQKLSPRTQKVLQLAACIGDKFNLDILSIVNQKSWVETAKELWEALQAGLILPLDSSYKIPLILTEQQAEQQISYKFLHDRVQQASYSLIPDVEKKNTHFTIGKLLLQKFSPEEQKEHIFYLVNHLKYGIDLLTYDWERYELIELNLIAGKKAKATAAYESAMGYLKICLSLLNNSSWYQQYELTLNVHQQAAEVAFLSGDFEQMELLAEIVLQQAKTQLEKVRVYELRIKSCEVQRKLMAAVQLGLEVLEILGIKLNQAPTELDIQQAIQETTNYLAGKQIEDLIHSPAVTDAHKLAAMRLIASLVPAAYQSAPKLFILIACQQVNLSIQYGNTPFSASGFADFGIVFSGLCQDIDAAYQVGQLALNLLESLDTYEVKSQVLFKVATFIIHWKHHVKDTLPLLEAAYFSGLETGDLVHTGYSASKKCQYAYWSGAELTSLEQEMARYSQAIAQIHQETALKWHQVFHQAVLNLLGLSANPCLLIGEAYNEAELLAVHIQSNERTIIHYVFLNKLILCYLLGDFHQAVENASKAEQYLDGVTGWLNVPLFHFYDSLAQLAIYPSATSEHQKLLLDKVNHHQQKMQTWASYAPMNFQHKYELVEAEKARVLGQYWQATAHYDKAIMQAQEQGYIQEAALANELAAKFYFETGRDKVAQIYLIDAYYGYSNWGAIAKLRDLEVRYPQIVARLSERQTPNSGKNQLINAINQNTSEAFDLATVMKAAQALSGEIVLDKLLAKLMQILLENAGAATGYLILNQADTLLIAASGSFAQPEINVRQSTPVESSENLPISVINYVYRTGEHVVLSNANCEGVFTTDDYIVKHQPKSILCSPIVNQGKLIGILYLENKLIAGAFTPERLEVLQLLSSQAAISLENARLYHDLEEYNRTLETKVKERTLELQAKNFQLQQEIQERQKAEEAAAAANRAKSEFLANMSHELRTPLNGILGYTQIFQTDTSLSSQQRNGVNIIHQCGEHLLTLINDILDISKIEARKMDLELKEFNFPAFLEGIAEICHLRAEMKGIALVYQPLGYLPRRIRGDEKRLRQVLINLLSNAVKFTKKGRISFKVGYVTQDGDWILNGEKLTSQSPTPKIRFLVEDTGIGIAHEQLEEIFLPFKQAGEDSLKTEGTGLGLSISRQLVQMMGGELCVKSELSKGSIFWLDLALPEVEEQLNFEIEPLNIIGFAGCKRKILVVDDKWENRSVLVNILEPLGFEVLAASDGLDCLDKIPNFQPDLILMDLVMTGMDGFEATRRLRLLPNFKEVVVIAVSASVFEFNQQESRNVGCDDFLSKPIQRAELLEKLQVHLGLTWVYEDKVRKIKDAHKSSIDPLQLTSQASIVPPSADELKILLDLAMRGDLRSIAERTQKLQEQSEELQPFATRLYQLAKGFKGKQILEFLQKYSEAL
ncbi:AAA family ATPase [Nostoc sp. FACHB-87]|uniref:hybrid sensor histidine kinase/response regulator n=1 Tax=Nostocaceae TaxID=1162 RepID=UPI00168816CC|nr:MULTISPECIES: hybrid sensor histidine kinase/response regulator [Nostocaceae]MBD2454606.1 AAA family ATPase [Nostoc sp. FACHB-87]MBD2476349.1 AAA family ATPase [Anabaena sp. FACHB-83]